MRGPLETQWDLLPDQPEEFFGLSGNYELRDLKRSYNSFLRKFKPEKYPEEFQKIRAAFERLSDSLRYGEHHHQAPLPDLQFDWSQQENSSPPPPRTQEPLNHGPQPEPAPKRLQERIADESLPDLYRELAERDVKSPYDFYALAVLSDALQKEEPGFAGWLLEGLKAEPDEPALFELLREYCGTEQTPEQLEQLLEDIVQVVRSDR